MVLSPVVRLNLILRGGSDPAKAIRQGGSDPCCVYTRSWSCVASMTRYNLRPKVMSIVHWSCAIGCSEFQRSLNFNFWIGSSDVLAILKTYHIGKKLSKNCCQTLKLIKNSHKKSWVMHNFVFSSSFLSGKVLFDFIFVGTLMYQCKLFLKTNLSNYFNNLIF